MLCVTKPEELHDSDSELVPGTPSKRLARFKSVPPSPTGSNNSDLTLDSSLGGSSVVSLSQLSTTDIPKIPGPASHLNNKRVLQLLYPEQRRSVTAQPIFDEFDNFNKHAEGCIFGGFTVDELKKTFKFIAGDVDAESRSFGGFDGENLEAAFRKVKRARKQKSMEEEARKFMRTFRFLLQLSNKSPEQWFVETDTTPDCKLTWSEFEAGMQKLCTDLGGAMFSKNGLLAMLRYMDPFCLGELTAPEVKAAFKRIKLPSKSGEILSEAGEVFTFLQEFIQKRAVRVQDMFNLFDYDRMKSIDFRNFCFGVDRLKILLLSGGLVTEKPKFERKRPPTRPFDPIVGGRLVTPDQPAPNAIDSRIWAKSKGSSLNASRLQPIQSEDGLSSRTVEIAEAKKPKKPRIPPSPIRCPVLDTDAMKERKRLLNGISLPHLAPPRKINYNDIVQKGVNKFEPWLHHFDSTLKTGLILHSQS